MAVPVIEVRDFHKTYQLGEVEVQALRGVSLSIEQGEFVAFMGASGSGKSTLMNILGCLDRPDQGQYLLEGRDVATLDDEALARIRGLRIGFVFQNFNLLKRTSAAENVALPLFYSGRMADSQIRVSRALAAIGLAGRERNAPSQLSGGQQQRVAIARALINDPAILLADEPTGNLDSKTAEDIVATIQSFNREYGLTVVMVTHEPDIAAFADRVITMRDGSIISDQKQIARVAEHQGSVLDLKSMPVVEPKQASGYTKAFVFMALAAAWRALTRNKMRSCLTMLGIFIGVTALITMVAIGQGAGASVKAQIEGLGTNLIVILPGATTASGVRGGSGSAPTLTLADAEALRKEASAVAQVAVQNRQLAQLQYANQNWNTSVQGVSPSYLSIRNWKLAAGRPFTEEDEMRVARVGLVGQTVVKNLFAENENPVGTTIFIKNVPVEVIGILEAKGQSSGGQDQDDTVLLPFATAEQKILGVSSPAQVQANPYIPLPPPNPFGLKPKLTGYVNVILVQAVSTEAVSLAMDQVTDILRERHRIDVDADQMDDFAVRSINDLTRAAKSSTKIFSVLLASVASISLVVGGIGIMNILLVSVTERTREIGIRMAIGARRIQVLFQFLVESILLSLIGGTAGIFVGMMIAWMVSFFAGWPILLSPWAAVLAFFFSAAVGVFFGYYPARRAAHLNPIEALRFE